MFVIPSNFDVPPFSLPDLGSNNSFGDFVDAEESEILKKLLGKTFFDQFMAGLEAAGDAYSSTTTYENGDVVSSGNNVWTSLQAANMGHPLVEGSWWTLTEEDNKWLVLKNGGDYEYAEIVYEWSGMVKMLVPYIWYRWVKESLTDFLSGNGLVSPAAENGSVISPGPKLCAAYNRFSKIAGGNFCLDNSLYGFLVVNAVDYENAEYYPQGTINTFNI